MRRRRPDRFCAIDSQIEVFENVEHLRNVHAAGTRRRKADDLVAAIRRVQRLANLCLVRGKVGGRDDAAVGRHPFADLLRELAAIEPIGAVLGNLPIRVGQIGLHEPLAGRNRLAIGVKENRPRAFELVQILSLRCEPLGVAGADLKSVARRFDARRQRAGQLDRATPLERNLVRRERPGTPDASGPVWLAVGIGLPSRTNISLFAAAGAISRPSIAVNFPSAVRIRIRHPPPMPEFSPSTTPSVSAAVTAASTALPPSRKTSNAGVRRDRMNRRDHVMLGRGRVRSSDGMTSTHSNARNDTQTTIETRSASIDMSSQCPACVSRNRCLTSIAIFA